MGGPALESLKKRFISAFRQFFKNKKQKFDRWLKVAADSTVKEANPAISSGTTEEKKRAK